jgi:asparagine synthase (glutamine-hydrolysing)
MCGIFAIFNKNNKSCYYNSFNKGIPRGPENSKFLLIENNIFGFHRLAINGYQHEQSDQPLQKNNCILLCNGEIYNYKSLYEQHNLIQTTRSDCEIIIDMYTKYGIDFTTKSLGGVFAFVLYDSSKQTFFVCRDTFGVRPLFIAYSDTSIGVSSELKMLQNHFQKIKQFPPNYYSEFRFLSRWNKTSTNKLFDYNLSNIDSNYGYNNILTNIKYYLTAAVKKRVENTERPIACLLSGGLDSSLITSLVCNYYKSNNIHKKVKTFSIGMKGASDLHNAEVVAKFLDTDHTTIELTEEEFLDAIPKVIETIESYDTTTVRASVGNYLVSKYISEHCDSKVIFNGDGSDEVSGGYLYFHKCPTDEEFHNECVRLLDDICFFDVLRSDRSISSNGLEARTPFLDRNFVNYYLSIPKHIRNHNNGGGHIEKYLIRNAFKGYLPDSVLFRKKEAFSDGVSHVDNSWHTIIHNKLLSTKLSASDTYTHNKPNTKEQLYYREIFERFYANSSNVIPYFWMPTWVNATDASARELDLY